MDVQVLGRVDYAPTYQAMQDYTASRGADTPDALWLCEHPPVFTLGLAAQTEHLIAPGDIPVVQTNRGGQVTYHGPGQVMAYALVDLKRAGYFVKEFVYRLEEAVIRTLAHYGITGHRVRGAPGIYVHLDNPGGHERIQPSGFEGLGKIAALGIKVSRNCTYHGLALNVAMDLEPYSRINPCGYAGLKTVDLSTIGISADWSDVARILGDKLRTHLAP